MKWKETSRTRIHSELIINYFITNFPILRTNLTKPNQVPKSISLYKENLLSRDKGLFWKNCQGQFTIVLRGRSLPCLLYMEWNCRGQKISVSKMSFIDWCMMFVYCCVITCVNISTCVVRF